MEPKVITPIRHKDKRGFFSESWNKKNLLAEGIDIDFVQDNHSLSNKTGTLRGLHFQYPPYTQAKLVRCGQGSLFDIAVDIRKGSPTFGRWVGEELSFENGKQLFIPQGFLHGFITLEPYSEIIYKCSNYYAPDYEGYIRYDDPDIAIDWPINPDMDQIDTKDKNAPFLRKIQNPFFYEKI